MTEFRSRRHTAEAAVLEKHRAAPVYDENLNMIGISLGRWSITSSSSRIGNEFEIHTIESAVQSKLSGNRRLCLPEIVFANAFVKLKMNSIAELCFKAQDALEEWAECHEYLDNKLNECQPYKGVSVIKSADAKLWEERVIDAKDITRHGVTSLGLEKCSTEFNYDWTFSSPFSGKFVSKSNAQPYWTEINESGININMLIDQSQPILYYDDVSLYEDDMHDNGFVSLRCKLRVMPRCFYVLLSLFVRVDHVLIRVKEVRLFSMFPDEEEGTARIYKDITWRECLWKDLPKQSLPSSVKDWRIEDEDISSVQHRIYGLIQNLPVSSLPQNVFRHSYIDVFE